MSANACMSATPTCSEGARAAGCVPKKRRARRRMSDAEMAVYSRRLVANLRRMGDRVPRYRWFLAEGGA